MATPSRPPSLNVHRSPFQIIALLSLLFFFCLSANALAADNSTPAFDAANKLYEQGKFSEAAAAYETLIQSGSVSPALYFNLGNARFKSSQLGRAIAAYRQAAQSAPRDPDIRANLQFARNQVQGPTLPPSRWERWLETLTLNEWTALTALALWIWLLTLALCQLRPTWKTSLRTLTLGSGLTTVAMGLFLVCVFAAHTQPTAIATAHDDPLRSGPLDEAQTVFTAHDGAELAILDTKDNWLQVSAGQRSGWLKRELVLQFPPLRPN